MRLNLANNFGTELAESISDTTTSFEVADLSDAPATPYRMTIHEGETKEGEIIEVNEHDKEDNQIVECERGMEDTTAQSWDAGNEIEQFSTAGYHSELTSEMSNLDSDLSDHKNDTNNPHSVTSDDLDLADVASSGDYDDLDNIPSEFTPEEHDNEAHSVNFTDYDSSDFDNDFDGADISRLTNDEGYTDYDSGDFDNDFDGADISRLNNDEGYTDYEFSEDYQDLSNRTHGNEDHGDDYYSSGDSIEVSKIEISDSNAYFEKDNLAIDVTEQTTGWARSPLRVHDLNHDASASFGVRDDGEDGIVGKIGLGTEYHGNWYDFQILRFWIDDADLELNNAGGDTITGGDLYEDGDRVATRDWTSSNFNDYSLETHDNSHHSDNYTTTSPSDVNSTNWDDYEIQKNGSDDSGIINFKT